ncbi:transcriptional regulator [Paracoccus aeridis]|uniref:transcriptional regulator n=1 Tax=Paracoccus aeridis TaxID=1966466 RepID=UPI0010A9DD47|nr:transcriptional regulator [Paracoccus aeridis]
MTIQDLISEADYAAQRGVSARTIQRERALRIGPPFIKMGRRIFYRPAAIESWLLAKEQAQPRAPKREVA